MLSVHVGPVEPRVARSLVDSAVAHDGVDPLGEDALSAIERGGDTDEAVTVTAGDPGAPVALVHVRTIATLETPHAELRLVATPDAREPRLLATMVRTATLPFVETGSNVVAWFPGAPGYADDAAEAAGFEPQRVLFRMEGPIAHDAPTLPDDVTIRTLSLDEAGAWVTLNNRTFAGHPEQGAWTLERFTEARGESWFDLDGFLVAEADGTLVGFCWTKQHDDDAGEIYVIGVDPDHHGSGLGRALTVAGLASLRARGSTHGLLYVDAANEAAVALYRSLGFEVTRSDAAWVREANR